MEKTYQLYRRLDNEREGLDWAIRHNGEHVTVRYGPTGEETRQFSIPSRLCKDGQPWKERGEHTQQRLRDGYVCIGVGKFPSVRLELVERARSDSLALHWETVQPLARRRVSELMAYVHEGLRRIGLQPVHIREGLNGEPGLVLQLASRLWKLRRLPNGQLVERDESGIARVSLGDGTVPILVLMRIAREFPDSVRMTWREPDESQVIAPRVEKDDYWLGRHVGPFDETRRVARALGLGPEHSLLAARASAPDPLWF